MAAFASSWYFLLALLGFGFVIAIHEFGHFTFAKLAGVKVLRFSIGFGPIVWSRRFGETEYSLSLLPFGGYVKMAGEENPAQGASEGEASDPRSYLNASRPWKALILLGGVLFNLASSWLILVGLGFWGMPMRPPVVADVQGMLAAPDGTLSDSPAKRLGLRRGDLITDINGRTVRSFDDIAMALATDNDQPVALVVERDGARLRLPADGARVFPVTTDHLPVIGIDPPRGPDLGAVARFGSASASAEDPRPGERITAIAGERLPEGIFGQQIIERLRPWRDRDVALTLAEGGQERTTTIRYAGPIGESSIEYPVRIAEVPAGSPAAAAGLRAGDLVRALNEQTVASVGHLIDLIQLAPSDALRFHIDRGAEELDLTVMASAETGRRFIGARLASVGIGRLPFLPTASDGWPGALARAGLGASDGLMVGPVAGEKDKPEYLALAGVDEVHLELSRVDKEWLLKSGLFGRRSPAERLLARRIAAPAKDGALELEDRHGIHSQLALAGMTSAGRDRLAGLAIGDWLAGLDLDGDGSDALVVLRGATLPPRVLDVQPSADAIALEMSPYYEPPHRIGDWREPFAIANSSARRMVTDTLSLIPKFFRPAAAGGINATQTLSGPIGIFSEFKTRAERVGFASFLKLVALIGLNLFLVNLLPIPIVDGGQLVFLGLEAIMRRPLPEPLRNAANYAGLAVVVMLMVFTLGIDIWRKLGWL